MGCLLALLALLAPRVAIAVLAVFTRTLHDAFESALWPILGFLFLPYTTLAYTWAMNSAGGVKGAFWVVVVIVAVLLDLGSLRSARSAHPTRFSFK